VIERTHLSAASRASIQNNSYPFKQLDIPWLTLQ